MAKKKQIVCLIDAKRGQNAGIALARIKFPFEEIRDTSVICAVFILQLVLFV